MVSGERHADILIVGAGIIGLTIARELVEAGYDDIVIIEKEPQPGLHASGRNSGVLHAGIYYAPDSLKAKSCLNGNLLMREYCREKGLPLLENGKVIVTRCHEEIPVLKELHRRATANGAKVDLIDEKELSEIEPNARTIDRALFSHYTAVVDPKKVLESLKKDLEESGRVKFFFKCRLAGLKGKRTAVTTQGNIDFRFLINAAGAYSDKVAQMFGIARRYRMVPFKGTYRRLREGLSWSVNSSIYPVPDIRNPFLGIHLTLTVDGHVHLGPTAIPAFGRENYGVLSGINSEGINILMEDAVLFLFNPKFRNVALSETRKYFPSHFFQEASRLVKKLYPADLVSSPKVGIRAQLVDWTTKELVIDFLLEADDDSIHILNPISPAFTSAMDLSRNVIRDHFAGPAGLRPHN
jgi:L-2-hydroxyglutarate oxidase